MQQHQATVLNVSRWIIEMNGLRNGSVNAGFLLLNLPVGNLGFALRLSIPALGKLVQLLLIDC